MKTSPIMVGPSVPSPSLASLFGACCLHKQFRGFFPINQKGKKPVKCKVVSICIDCTARSFDLTPPVARLEGTMQRQVYNKSEHHLKEKSRVCASKRAKYIFFQPDCFVPTFSRLSLLAVEHTLQPDCFSQLLLFCSPQAWGRSARRKRRRHS